MKGKPFNSLENGDVFRFVPTGEIMAKVSRTKVLVIEPKECFEEQRGKIVKLVGDDLISDCLVLDLTKGFYKD